MVMVDSIIHYMSLGARFTLQVIVRFPPRFFFLAIVYIYMCVCVYAVAAAIAILCTFSA